MCTGAEKSAVSACEYETTDGAARELEVAGGLASRDDEPALTPGDSSRGAFGARAFGSSARMSSPECDAERLPEGDMAVEEQKMKIFWKFSEIILT